MECQEEWRDCQTPRSLWKCLRALLVMHSVRSLVLLRSGIIESLAVHPLEVLPSLFPSRLIAALRSFWQRNVRRQVRGDLELSALGLLRAWGAIKT